MLSFLSFMQKLSAYHALKKESIRYPDSPIFHVQNNLPVRETFTEATAYIIHSDDCLQIPKDNQIYFGSFCLTAQMTQKSLIGSKTMLCWLNLPFKLSLHSSCSIY